jgi:hypothetical protein
MVNAGSMGETSKTKRLVVRITKTQKLLSASLTIFLGTIAVIAYFKQCTTKKAAGQWYLTFKVEKSAYKPFIGETHSQKVFFTQNENIIKGDGEKWEYNGKYLPSEMHRLLEYEGTINGNKLMAKYVLHGEKRDSKGMIDVEISDDGKTVKGTFSGTAGESSGTVTGEKVN